MNEKTEKLSLSRIYKNNIYALKALFGPTPVWGISIVVEAIRHNLILFLEQTICVFKILNVIENNGSYFEIVKVVLIFLALDLVASCISSLYENKIKVKYLPLAENALKMKMYVKAKDVDIENYDNPKYYNDYCLVVSEVKKAIERAEQIVRMGVGSVTMLICYGGFFLTQDALSVVIVFISFFLRTLFANMSAKLSYKVRLQEVPLERKRDYIRRVFYLKDYAKELRLNKKVAGTYHKQFDEIQEELYVIKKKMAFRKFLLEFSSKYLASDFLLDIIYVLYLIIRATLLKVISFSQVVVLYNSAAGLRRGFSTITDLGPYAIETSLYIEKIRRFLDTESKIINDKKCDLPTGNASIECRNLCFGYDDQKPILNNVNLVINPGEKVALVGLNGAGKTTLIKLLLRLDDPTEGCILLNGRDIKDYDLDEYRRYIGVIFQDFQIYATTIRNNVSMDVDTKDDDRIVESIKLGGLEKRIAKLPEGINTEITKEFNDSGTEFSGGEEQKLAVARTFYKDAGMFFLDEPSSALDPIAEYKLNETMKSISKEKNVIYISHRLSTTRNADKIYVMKSGRIVESGSHAELLTMNGLYKTMWEAQASKYLS